ncbi:MAG TPA: hypothetical protein VHN10_14060 [Candidatus Acidoferrales bacterium]|jgi:hypothetical protein|nr:hypothetical protein [Candidatus Acidoferrales bacterium]
MLRPLKREQSQLVRANPSSRGRTGADILAKLPSTYAGRSMLRPYGILLQQCIWSKKAGASLFMYGNLPHRILDMHGNLPYIGLVLGGPICRRQLDYQQDQSAWKRV